MTDHRLNQARQAIQVLYDDVSVTTEITRRNLQTLRDEIALLLETLEADA
ncbi:MAG: hypothetical protein KDD73_16950 [Anaerolineales bacterium]|nr:hypothetical protein [Anaerolineales bacterium]